MPEEKKYYCGVGPVPRGKVRGTPEYCVQTNQVRYYGLVKIDKDLLKTAKGETTDLIKEQLKLKKLEDDARVLIRDAKNLNLIIEDDTIKKSKRKQAREKMKKLMEKREKLIKSIKSQRDYVNELKEEKEKEEKRAKKEKKKEKEKKKKSGSKSKKKKV